MQYIGCHLTISKGFSAMGRQAVELGANTAQFFTRNPRGGKAKDIDPADIQRLRDTMAQHGFGPLIAHAPYTINPCAQKPETLEFARITMADDLRRLEYLPGTLYNFHPGSHVGQGPEAAVEKIAQTLNQVLFPGMQTTVLLETMAGKGSEIGRSFEELRTIIDGTAHSERLGVCLDSCHVYDAGYDIVGHLDDVLAEFDRVIGLDRLKAVHLNDSKNPFASHKDRHEKIGAGSLGLDAIGAIINHPALRDLPFYLETPNELDGYAREIALLKSMRTDR